MKKILFLLVFIPVLAQAQSAAQLPVTHFTGKVSVVGTCDTIVPEDFIIQNPGWSIAPMPNNFSRIHRLPDCEAWETFTDWQAKNTGKTKCVHDWVVAEWNEVNTISAFTTLEMPPPCGKTRHDNEARICRTCLRHETRVRTHGMKEVVRKSEFQTLLEKIHDR